MNYDDDESAKFLAGFKKFKTYFYLFLLEVNLFFNQIYF